MFGPTLKVLSQHFVFGTLIVAWPVAWAADTSPDPISFAAIANAEPGSPVMSGTQTVSGVDTAVPIRVTGGFYSVNGGAFTAASGRVANGDTVRVQQTASGAFDTSTTATLRIGTPLANANFKVTTRKADTTPAPFAFTRVQDAALGSVQASAPVTIVGIEAPATITVSGGSYSINDGEFSTRAGSIGNNDRVRARGTASNGTNQTTTVKIKIGGVIGSFRMTTAATLDTTPDSFSFPRTVDAEPGSVQTSVPATIGGIDSASPVSIVGGSYSINGGTFAGGSGLVRNGDQVSIRLTAPAGFSTSTAAQLNIGGVSGEYSVVTRAADTIPDAFGFAGTLDAELGSTQTSEAVTIAGIEGPAAISIVGGFYSLNSGPYTDEAALVSAGDVLRVQVLAAYSFSNTRAATVTIGGVAGQYSVTTRSLTADRTVDGLRFGPIENAVKGSVQYSAPAAISGINVPVQISIVGGRYSISGSEFTDQVGSVVDGDSVVVEVQASSSPATATAATVTIGTGSADFTVTTAADADVEPDAFSFAPAFDVAPGSTQISQPIAVSGINVEAPISIEGGRYGVNGGDYGSAAGSVRESDSVTVELLASNDFAVTTTTTLTIGSVAADYRVTTRAADTTPEPFALAPIPDASPGSRVVSAPITITGIDAPTPVAIIGGRYSVNGGAYTDADGSLVNGDRLSIEVQAGAFATTVSATVTVGGVGVDFMVTSGAADTTPEAFSFTDNPAGFPLLASVSSPITVSGINAPITAGITGGEYSVNGSPFLSMPGPVVNGDVVRVLAIPGPNNGDVRSANLNLGGVNAAFIVTTNSPADNFSDLYQFRVAHAPANATVFSEQIRINGINLPVAISVAGGSYSINGEPFTTTASTIKGGDLLQLRATADSHYDRVKNVALLIGAFGQNWSIRTDSDPQRLAVFDLVNATIFAGGQVLPGSPQTTEPVTVHNPPGGLLPISVSGGGYSVNGGPFTTLAGTVVDGDRVLVRFDASTTYSTSVSVTLSIGNHNATLSVTTVIDPVAATPAAHEGCEPHVYREFSPVPLRLFVCYPAGWRSNDRRSAIVHWFGGGFIKGDTDQSIDEARYWANAQGMVGIAPDYRVNNRFGTYAHVAADDARAAVKWVEENAATLGIDPARVVVSGMSAGGGVAFFAALRDAPVTGSATDNPPLRPAAIVSRSGVPDISEDSNVAEFATLARFGGNGAAASASRHLDAAFPPVIMAQGDRDTTVAATPSVNFCTALIRLGRVCQFDSKADAGHGLSSDRNLGEIHEETRAFLTQLGLLPAQ